MKGLQVKLYVDFTLLVFFLLFASRVIVYSMISCSLEIVIMIMTLIAYFMKQGISLPLEKLQRVQN